MTQGLDDYSERIFGLLLDTGGWMAQQDIIKGTRMAQATAITTLQTMVADGEVEWARLYRGVGGGSGAPKHIYRLRKRNVEAA
jgi:hypothetical protein